MTASPGMMRARGLALRGSCSKAPLQSDSASRVQIPSLGRIDYEQLGGANMKLSIYGVICDACKGEGFVRAVHREGSQLVPYDKLCGKCNGTGVFQAPVDRSDPWWERE